MRKKQKSPPIKLTVNWREMRIRLWSFFLGIITILIVLGINTHAFDLRDYIRNSVGAATYTAYTVSNLNDDVTILVANFCSAFDKEEQVRCIVTQVTSFYNYTMHNDTMRTPTEVLNEGGVCRDAAVLYSTVFQRLGWRTTFNYPAPYHVNLIAAKEYHVGNTTQYYNCLIDQQIYRCDIY